jgi:AraC family transcriptional regulator of adaptative response/methylated-DNA-[protein]-cysteine methyltransferase
MKNTIGSIHIERMTPDEYKNGGATLSIRYQFTESPFGKLLVASTAKGICYLAFVDDEATAFSALQKKFPNAQYIKIENVEPLDLNSRFNLKQSYNLHLKGTDFQQDVWQALLNIPKGTLTSYSAIARQVNRPQAQRAVGTAIGDNPVAILIPCHRVLRSSGGLGGYHWGLDRKKALINWETNSQL